MARTLAMRKRCVIPVGTGEQSQRRLLRRAQCRIGKELTVSVIVQVGELIAPLCDDS